MEQCVFPLRRAQVCTFLCICGGGALPGSCTGAGGRAGPGGSWMPGGSGSGRGGGGTTGGGGMGVMVLGFGVMAASEIMASSGVNGTV